MDARTRGLIEKARDGDVAAFDALIRWGTISPADVNLFKVCDTPKDAFEFLKMELLKHYPKPQMWISQHAP